MAKQFQLGKTILVSEMTWSVLADRVRNMLNADEQYVIAGDADLTQMIGIADEAPKGKSYSLGALLADHARSEQHTTCLYFLECPGNQCAVVGILEGCPADEFDVFGSYDLASQVAHDFVSRFGDMPCYGMQLGDKPALEFDLEDFLGTVDPKALKSALLKNKPFDGLWMIIVCILILGLCGKFGWDYYQKKKIEEEIAAQELNNRPPQVVYDEDIVAPAVKNLWGLDDGLRALDQVSALRLKKRNWGVTKITCSAANNECIAKWQRDKKSATLADFVNSVSEQDRSRLLIHQDSIDERIPQKVAAFNMGNALPSVEQHINGVIKTLEFMGSSGDAQMSFPDFSVIGTPAADLKKVLVSKVSIQGNLYLMPLLMEMAGPGVGMSGFEITLNKDSGTFKCDLQLLTRK